LGLPEDVVGMVVPSPFDYANQGQLRIPRMLASPTDAAAHTEELSEVIPELLVEFQSGLVLFTSWRQFFAVVDNLSPELRDLCLLQGEDNKSEMLRKHRERIDAGHHSYLLGLASFAEGVDLPGDYCLQVIIAKIPFSVPDDPVGATQQEWIEASGGNAFTDFMLPNAALRLTQAAGRLLRTESDQGVVTILDDRLRTKFYGPRLRSALPPFRDYDADSARLLPDHG
ncbi:MAG: helicase C-terminal domain-containing protein, partial [Pseudomonadales bacterium]